MSEHADTKNSTFAAIVVMLIIAGLVTWGIGLMNSGAYLEAAAAGGLLFAFGLYACLVLGRD